MGVNMDSPHIQDAYRIRLERVAPEENCRMLSRADERQAVHEIRLSATREAIRNVLVGCAMSVDEIAHAVDGDRDCIRRQVQRLHKADFVKFAGRVRSDNGRWVKLWSAA